MSYRKHTDDVGYRYVSLKSAGLAEKEFLSFDADDREIPDPHENQILEILHSDGSMELIAAMPVRTIHYRICGNEIILLNPCPQERLWVRKADLAYKCPSSWKRKSETSWFCQIADAAGAELFGDRYLSKAFSFVRD